MQLKKLQWFHKDCNSLIIFFIRPGKKVNPNHSFCAIWIIIALLLCEKFIAEMYILDFTLFRVLSDPLRAQSQTRKDLAQARNDLIQTRNDLTRTRNNLTQTRNLTLDRPSYWESSDISHRQTKLMVRYFVVDKSVNAAKILILSDLFSEEVWPTRLMILIYNPLYIYIIWWKRTQKKKDSWLLKN